MLLLILPKFPHLVWVLASTLFIVPRSETVIVSGVVMIGAVAWAAGEYIYTQAMTLNLNL